MSAFSQVRKYLAILSTFFVLIAFVDLVVIYLYDGSKVTPEHGGNVSIGMIGGLPNMNPVQFRMDPGNDFVLRFLYRSLLRYDTTTRTMQGDLANCDLGKNLSEIRCFFKEWSKWSDGTPITRDDVIATYNLLDGNDSNPALSAALGKMEVSNEDGVIVFRTDSPNIDLLDVFTVPIVRQDIAKKLETTSPKAEEMVYSGPYTFEKHESDVTHSSEKINLVENTNYTGDIKPYVSRYSIRFFTDKNALLSMKDSLHFIYPSREISSSPTGRFAEVNVLLPEYVMLFANASRVTSSLRSFVLFQIGNSNIFDEAAKLGKVVKNPFGGEDTTVPTLENPNVETSLANLGYFHPEALDKEIKKAAEAKKTAQVSQANTLSYFTLPSKSKTIVAGESDDVLISGSVPEGVDAVYINDYRLQSYKAGAKEFFYRAKTEMGNLKEGNNTYTLAFSVGGKKITKETMTIVFIRDSAAREAKKTEIAKTAETAQKAAEAKTQELSKADEEATKKLAGLNKDRYYDRSGKELIIKLSYLGGDEDIKTLAFAASKVLENAGIGSELKEVSSADVASMVKEGKKDYDFLLTGVNLGLLGYNIFPFFHSGQAEIGYNFSKLKNQSLDVLLEELKSKDTGKDGFQQIRDKILAILKKEAVVLTFYSPKNPIYVDRSLQGTKAVETIPYYSYAYDMLETAFIKEERLADFSTKSTGEFWKWLKNLLSL